MNKKHTGQRKIELFPSIRLTEKEGHFFFGYYDLAAYSRNNRYHLFHRTSFIDRLPRGDDIATIGMIDREQSNQLVKLDETNAWNFQQGAMLQWDPYHPDDKILYNIKVKDKFHAVQLDIHTGEKRKYPLPISSVSPKGEYALSINYSRMFDFRPGYGYAGISDPWKNIYTPADDGVFKLDLKTGKYELILSLANIWEATGHFLAQSIHKILVNHITVNADGTRFVMLVRYFPEANQRWGTVVITADATGNNLSYLSHSYDVASHYHWKNNKELIIYAQGPEQIQLYEWKDQTSKMRLVDMGFFREDGHCSYSPDRQWLLYDSYPDQNRMQHLYLYHLASNMGFTLGSYYSMPAQIDMRCDLHPRWNALGHKISFDSTHEGVRAIYEMDLTQIIEDVNERMFI